MPDFQQQVGINPAPAVEGDFASANPRQVVLAGGGALVAPAAGCTVGRFGWVDSTETFFSNTGRGAPDGFVSRQMQALITIYLAIASYVVPSGYMVSPFSRGDFWMRTKSVAVRGQKAFASLLDGSLMTAATGSTIAGASATGAYQTANSNVLTISAVTSGVINPGTQITGAGIPAGTYITSQSSGTTGGVGNYVTTYAPPAPIAAEAVTTSDYVETRWSIGSSGAVGELVKITTSF